jgi:hypothetical protein
MTQRSPQPAIHPSEDFRARGVQYSRYVPSGGLTIYHSIQAPIEYEMMYTQHGLLLEINSPNPHQFRQVNRIAGQEYDGSFPPGSLFLLPARVPVFSAWNQTDESIAFMMEPSKLVVCQESYDRTKEGYKRLNLTLASFPATLFRLYPSFVTTRVVK